MLAIILSACLANDPHVCKDYRLSVDSSFDLMQCALQAPPYFAQWNELHPGWQIKRWHCTNGSDADL